MPQSPYRNRALHAKVECMRIQLVPFYRLPTGPPHPRFPKSILHFWLLNESDLESIAHYYSQAETDQYTSSYPVRMHWDDQAFALMSAAERLHVKRMELGRFIGLWKEW